jgi:sugar O-acyltransferase (sialic acid O-acetyltransferase NeuD family)
MQSPSKPYEGIHLLSFKTVKIISMKQINSKLLLYGSGGHSKVLIDCLLKQNIHVQGIFDDSFHEDIFYNIKVLGKYDPKKFSDSEIIIAIGNNEIRKKISGSIKHNFCKIIADSSQISNFTAIGKGTVVLQNAVIQSGISIGFNSIINAGAIIDHDSIIESFVHISPGAIISNNVKIGEGSLIGAGSIITKNKVLPPWTVIPPGTVV